MINLTVLLSLLMARFWEQLTPLIAFELNEESSVVLPACRASILPFDGGQSGRSERSRSTKMAKDFLDRFGAKNQISEFLLISAVRFPGHAL
jgi:hypothetical protein